MPSGCVLVCTDSVLRSVVLAFSCVKLHRLRAAALSCELGCSGRYQNESAAYPVWLALTLAGDSVGLPGPLDRPNWPQSDAKARRGSIQNKIVNIECLQGLSRVIKSRSFSFLRLKNDLLRVRRVLFDRTVRTLEFRTAGQLMKRVLRDHVATGQPHRRIRFFALLFQNWTREN